MKKLLLSTIIMFAVCSFATAQNSDLRSAKTAKKTTTPAITNAAAAKPEKAAVNKSDEAVVKTNEDGTASAKTNDLGSKPNAASTDVKAAKQNEAAKKAPVKKDN
ncbi:MAG: hypothetical protein R2765_03380 [Ferruginibacter sp.]|nr:hypothetical protein [Bacteroidota bacterium]MBX2919113.1 hypothetical protein [Ferruginibacter sp.]MCB0708908.1 hypothetical protein [Chitinophagaceae bacterium]MCC7377805.1 hypothetical protein [Chitinophagaceae bacterium]